MVEGREGRDGVAVAVCVVVCVVVVAAVVVLIVSLSSEVEYAVPHTVRNLRQRNLQKRARVERGARSRSGGYSRGMLGYFGPC